MNNLFKSNLIQNYNYLSEGMFNRKIDTGPPIPVIKWVLQVDGYIKAPNDVFIWKDSLIDSAWDDTKVWTETAIP